MKYVIICILALMSFSCKKQETVTEIKSTTVLVTVEAVNLSGESKISPVIVVR